MKTKYIMILTAILILSSVYGDGSRNKKMKYNKYLISQLEQGSLLVRLKTKQRSYDKLVENGKIELAEKIKAKQERTNKAIIRSFKENFTFCPVYFFSSDQSKLIRSKELDKVLFYNDSLELDSLISPENDQFLTAEFGMVAPDTISGNNNYNHQSGFSGFVIKGQQFEKIGKPFPYVVKLSAKSIPLSIYNWDKVNTNDIYYELKKMNYAITKMNAKLLKFSQKMQKFDQ